MHRIVYDKGSGLSVEFSSRTACPLLRSPQRRTRTLCHREFLEQFVVRASDQDSNRAGYLAFRVAEVRTARQFKDGLLGRGHQRRAEFGAHPLGIKTSGVALDEPDGRCAIRQLDRGALRGHGDDRCGCCARE